MRFRRAILIPLLLAAGCQDKKPDGSPVAGGTPAPADTTAAPAATADATPAVATTPAAPPLEGSIDGKPFRPTTVSIEGSKNGPFVTFYQGEGAAASTLQFQLPVPEADRLAGHEWTFGGKVDGDPVLTLAGPERKESTAVFGTSYTMTLRLTKQTRDAVEGVIDLSVKQPEGTKLKGAFTATYRKSPTAPLGPEDAPYIHGRIVVKAAKKTEKLAAGYVGVGADGKPYFNEIGVPVDVGQEGFAHAFSPERSTQLSWLASTADAITYRHLNVPPGDYLVYVRRDTVMSAWKRVTLKEGDQQTIDLTIDPAATGEVVVTLPTSDAKGPGETSLALVPAKADLPELGLGSEHYFNVATVKAGETTVKVSGIPAGKYRAVRGSDTAEVDVVAGKSVAVTLGPEEVIAIAPHPEGCLLSVRAQPGARKAGVVGEQAGALKVAVTAPPEDGRANQALTELLRDWLGLKRSQVELAVGATNRNKQFLIRGLTPDELRAVIDGGGRRGRP